MKIPRPLLIKISIFLSFGSSRYRIAYAFIPGGGFNLKRSTEIKKPSLCVPVNQSFVHMGSSPA